MIDLSELEATARAATPGPWCWEAHGQKSNDWTVGYSEDDNGTPLTGEIREPDFIGRKCVVIEQENSTGYSDAAYIAAANPATVLALVACLRDALNKLDGDYARIFGEPPRSGECLARHSITLGKGGAK